MKIIRLVIGEDVRAKELLGSLETVKAEKVVFVCRGHISLFSDTTFLKKLKLKAKAQGKGLAFVCSQKFIRDTLKSQKLEAYSTVVKDLEEGEEKAIADIFLTSKKEIVSQTESDVSEKKITSKSAGKPNFFLRKIQGGKKKPVRGKIFFAFLFTILLLGGVLFWVSPRAKIVIKPKLSVIPVTQNILITLPDPVIPKKDEELPVVQGIFVETEVVGTETFPATKRTYDLTNARGKVTLYNETSQEKFLVPSRLQASNGAIFRFLRNVTIPPRTEGGAGKLVVEVVADEYDSEEKPIGERGNIEAGTELFFPALRNETRELYYARANQGPLVGGSTLTHYFVQEGDFEKAQELLTGTFRARGIDQLKKEMTSRSEREGKKYVLLDDPRLLFSELTEVIIPHELMGQETQTFGISGRLKLRGLVFDQSEVSQFLVEKLRETQDHTKKLLHIDRDSAQYQLLEYEEFEENKWLKLSVEMQGVQSLDIDSDSVSAREWRGRIQKEVVGKSLSEVRSILTNFPEIERVLDIQTSPFWSETLPNTEERITFDIRSE